MQLHRREHDLDVQAILRDHQVIPRDQVERVRNVLCRLELDHPVALLRPHCGSLDEFGQCEVTGHREGRGPMQLLLRCHRGQRLRGALHPPRLEGRIGRARLQRELLQHELARAPGEKHSTRDMTGAGIDSK